jgi:hypothetical protein
MDLSSGRPDAILLAARHPTILPRTSHEIHGAFIELPFFSIFGTFGATGVSLKPGIRHFAFECTTS